MSDRGETNSRFATYRHLIRNPTLMTLWGGNLISLLGDILFNMAIVWAVYSYSQSMFQSSLIQVVWHLDRMLVGLIAGTVADRYNRKKILIVTNLLAAGIVGTLAGVIWKWENPSAIVILCFVFLLNGVITFAAPASYSIMPEVVGRERLADATGLYTAISRVVYIGGTSMAGIFISVFGVNWAVVVNAISFLLAVICISFVRLPTRGDPSTPQTKKPPFWKEFRDGWRVFIEIPALKMMVMLSVLINVASFMGPLLPGLIDQQLHAGVGALGMIEAAAVVGAIFGGILAGPLERILHAGRLMILGLITVGLSIIGISQSTWLPLTMVLFSIRMLGMTVTNIASATAMQMLVPSEYRGRAWGISSSLAVIAIPISSLIGGYSADRFGVSPLYLAGGVWFMCCAAFVWYHREIRTMRLSAITASEGQKGEPEVATSTA